MSLDNWIFLPLPELFHFGSQHFPPAFSNGRVEILDISRNRTLFMCCFISHFNDPSIGQGKYKTIKAVGNPNIKDTDSTFKLIKI